MNGTVQLACRFKVAYFCKCAFTYIVINMDTKKEDTWTGRQMEIMHAAGKLLASGGAKGLTIKNLANELQFTEAALYRHFTGKEEVVLSLLDHLCRELDALYARSVAGETNAEERFTVLFSEQLAYFHTYPHFTTVIFSDGLYDESARINEAILRIMQVRQKYLLPVIRDGQQCGLFRKDIPEEDLMNIVMGSVRLLMFQWRSADHGFDLIEKGGQLVRSLLTLIKN